jgi:hypothetical protein
VLSPQLEITSGDSGLSTKNWSRHPCPFIRYYPNVSGTPLWI